MMSHRDGFTLYCTTNVLCGLRVPRPGLSRSHIMNLYLTSPSQWNGRIHQPCHRHPPPPSILVSQQQQLSTALVFSFDLFEPVSFNSPTLVLSTLVTWRASLLVCWSILGLIASLPLASRGLDEGLIANATLVDFKVLATRQRGLPHQSFHRHFDQSPSIWPLRIR